MACTAAQRCAGGGPAVVTHQHTARGSEQLVTGSRAPLTSLSSAEKHCGRHVSRVRVTCHASRGPGPRLIKASRQLLVCGCRGSSAVTPHSRPSHADTAAGVFLLEFPNFDIHLHPHLQHSEKVFKCLLTIVSLVISHLPLSMNEIL